MSSTEIREGEQKLTFAGRNKALRPDRTGPLTCERDGLAFRQEAAQRLQQTLPQRTVPVAVQPVVPQTAVLCNATTQVAH